MATGDVDINASGNKNCIDKSKLGWRSAVVNEEEEENQKAP
jgi:hypothetical protein